MNKTQFSCILTQEGLTDYAIEQLWSRKSPATQLHEGVLRETCRSFIANRKRMGFPDKWFRTATRRECPMCLHQDHGHDPCPVLFCECQGQDFLFGGQPQ